MYDTPTASESRKFSLRENILEKVGWLVFVLMLGILSSALLMGVSYLVPVKGEGLDLEDKLLILKALDVDYNLERIEELFDEQVTVDEAGGLPLYKAKNGSVAFNFSGMGFQANISGLLALAPDLQTITALIILEQQETPGLGGRIAEEAFQKQFAGVAIRPEIVIVPTGHSATKPNEVDGITGATMTGNALEAILRNSIRSVIQQLEGN